MCNRRDLIAMQKEYETKENTLTNYLIDNPKLPRRDNYMLNRELKVIKKKVDVITEFINTFYK